jgi:hypothetical protein
MYASYFRWRTVDNTLFLLLGRFGGTIIIFQHSLYAIAGGSCLLGYHT